MAFACQKMILVTVVPWGVDTGNCYVRFCRMGPAKAERIKIV